MKWFDRAFSFDLPLWMYPNVLERLRGTPARVEYLVKDVRGDVLTARPKGRWSILENVGHLIDLEGLWLGRVDDILAGEHRMRAADLTNQKTHDAGHNDVGVSTLVDRFTELRSGLVTRLETVDDSEAGRSALHPRLEEHMRLIDLAFFVAEHDDHHLVEISQLKRR